MLKFPQDEEQVANATYLKHCFRSTNTQVLYQNSYSIYKIKIYF